MNHTELTAHFAESVSGTELVYIAQEVDTAIEALQTETERLKQAAQGQEPVAYQFQTVDGGWHPFLNDTHFANTKADGRWPIRALYAAPTAQQPATAVEKHAQLDKDIDRSLAQYMNGQQAQPERAPSVDPRLDKLQMAVIEMYSDWKKGDFELPKLAQNDLMACFEYANCGERFAAIKQGGQQ